MVTPSLFTKAVEDIDRRSDLEAKNHFSARRRSSTKEALRLMIGAFWRIYHTEKARREGVNGLFRAVNEGMFHFLTYAKHWELERNARKTG